MYRFFKYYIFLFWLISSIQAKAQDNSYRDSLLTYLKNSEEDTSKIKCLRKLFFEFEFEDTLKAKQIALQTISLSKKINDPTGEASGYTYLGYMAEDNGLFEEALNNHQKSLAIYQKNNNLNGVTSSFLNISSIYSSKGQFTQALQYSLLSLKNAEKLGDKKSLATCYTSIGGVYHGMEEYEKSLDYFLKALKIGEELGKENGLDIDLSNVGVAYKELKNFDKALVYFFKALTIAERFNKTQSILVAYTNIGGVYDEKHQYDKALEFFDKAKTIGEKIGDVRVLAVIYANMGSSFLTIKDYKNAEIYLLKSLDITEKSESLSAQKMAHEFLSDLYEETNRFEQAHYHFKQFSYLKDTIFNMEKYEDMTRQELTYEFDKKETILKAEQDKIQAIAAADKKRQRMFIGFLSSILIAVLIITFLVFRTLKLTKKQKQIIETQKELVEEKQKEILDSIRYAKRIQEAILTSQTYIERNIKRLKKL